MADKTVFVPLTERFDEQDDESVENGQFKERLRLAEEELEKKERQVEEYFVKFNALMMEAELSRIELHQIFNTSTDGMWIVDDQFNVVKVNDAFLNLLGKDRGEVVGGKCHELFHGSLCNTDGCPMTLIKKGMRKTESDVERKTGDALASFILTASRYQGLDGGMLGMVESFKDITDRTRMAVDLPEANRELQRIAVIDGLTQIANRRHFDNSLRQEWLRMARAKLPMSIIMCDVDFFKLYNDHYGHLLGDDCLCSVAHAIDCCVKRPADLAARFGGEEFAVLLPNTPIEGAAAVAESIRQSVQGLMIEHAASLVDRYVTLSLGVASAVPEYHASPQALLNASDKALYEAKHAGRNRVCAKLLSLADPCPQ